MRYPKIVHGIFKNRKNRFIAEVMIEDQMEIVHVKNTGRCREILTPDSEVILSVADNVQRKTRYDLIAAYKKDFGLINIDSQAPNQVVKEWLADQDYTFIKPEYTYGASRIDFYMEKGQEKYLMEVKGCTLEMDGIGYFPDAPTERGIKHIKELTKAVGAGYHGILAFVIQMEGVHEVRACADIHPEFSAALEAAKKAGVEVWFLSCNVFEDGLIIDTRNKFREIGEIRNAIY